jgi:hypothetical protein
MRRAPLRDDFVQVQASKRFAIEKSRGRGGAKAKAIDRLDRQFAIAGRAMPADAELGQDGCRQILAAHALAGFGTAKL